jgi:hypothetical protein
MKTYINQRQLAMNATECETRVLEASRSCPIFIVGDLFREDALSHSRPIKFCINFSMVCKLINEKDVHRRLCLCMHMCDCLTLSAFVHCSLSSNIAKNFKNS